MNLVDLKLVIILILGMSALVGSYKERPSAYIRYDCDSHEVEDDEGPPELPKSQEEVVSSSLEYGMPIPPEPPVKPPEEKRPKSTTTTTTTTTTTPSPPSTTLPTVEMIPEPDPIPSPDITNNSHDEEEKKSGDDVVPTEKPVEIPSSPSPSKEPELDIPNIGRTEPEVKITEDPPKNSIDHSESSPSPSPATSSSSTPEDSKTITEIAESSQDQPKVLKIPAPTPCPGFNRPCSSYFDCGFQSGSNDTRIWFNCDGKFCVCELLGSVRDENGENSWSIRWSKKNYKCIADLDGPCGFNNGLEVTCKSGTRCMSDKTCNKPGRVKVNKKTTVKPKDCDDDHKNDGKLNLFSLLFFPLNNVVDSILNDSLKEVRDQ